MSKITPEVIIRKIIDESIEEIVPARKKNVIKFFKTDFFSPSEYIEQSNKGVTGINIIVRDTIEKLIRLRILAVGNLR